VSRNKKLSKLAIAADPYNLRALNLVDLDPGHNTIVQRLRHITLISAAVDLDSAERLVQIHSRSRSQFHQDMLVLMATKEKQNGYFVEVGVGDGEFLSNTVLLEDEYGWKGLLCEPNVTFQSSIIERRKAMLEKRAIYRTDGEELQFLADDAIGELSRLVDAEGSDAHKRAGKTYSVYTTTLDQALEAANAPDVIDYVSIDTEGSEVAVLDGFNLSRWKVGIITIEHNNDRARRKEFASRLEPYGFVQVLKSVSGVDDWYVNRDYAPDFVAALHRANKA
jgi:FkbM family methyltransferase